jgi:hypothetical protein
LLEDTVQSFDRPVDAEFSCNRYGSRLTRVLELTMASLGSDMLPAIARLALLQAA